MQTVLNEYTREALCVTVTALIGNTDVRKALYPQNDSSEFIRTGNGPKLIAGKISSQICLHQCLTF